MRLWMKSSPILFLLLASCASQPKSVEPSPVIPHQTQTQTVQPAPIQIKDQRTPATIATMQEEPEPIIGYEGALPYINENAVIRRAAKQKFSSKKKIGKRHARR